MKEEFGLCDSCNSKCRVVKETTSSLYSYKRKGICYNVDYYCKTFGFQLYSFSPVVKCTANRPSQRKRKNR